MGTADSRDAPRTTGLLRRVLGIGAVGGMAFWVVNFAISLTPIGATYRGGLSISYAPMLVESALGGLVIGWVVTFLLFRFYSRIPGKTAVRKSVLLTLIAILAFALASGILDIDQPIAYRLLGAGINVLRFLALGWTIGYVSGRGPAPSSDVTRSVAHQARTFP